MQQFNDTNVHGSITFVLAATVITNIQSTIMTNYL